MPTPEELAAAQAVLDAVTQEEKVTFDEKQQKKVEDLIKGAKSAAAKELRQQYEALKADADTTKAELAKALEAVKAAKTPGEKKDAQGDVEALKAEIAEFRRASETKDAEYKRLQSALDDRTKEVQNVRSEAMNDRKRAAITDAAMEANFIKPDMVVSLTADKVAWDEDLNRWVVLENGVARKNSSFEPMTLNEFFTEYGTQNKFLVRGDVRPGSGSSMSSGARGASEVDRLFGPNADPKARHQLANSGATGMARYRQLKEQALAKGYKV